MSLHLAMSNSFSLSSFSQWNRFIASDHDRADASSAVIRNRC
jgi:hypothetical protein